ncbi:MAG: kelch repeat-containing protein, partial [Kofleriaceae bacterium]
MKWLIGVVLCSGCVTSNSVTCGDQSVCPAGDACDDLHHLCVLPEQLTVCGALQEGDECTASSVSGHCLDGVCLPSVCGDQIVEFAEMCDDGNTLDGVTDDQGVLALDSCSADCHSDFTCGNHLVDVLSHEECDDHNNLDHDGCSSSCRIETPRWSLHTLAPTPRSGSSSAYDSTRDRMIVFGGYDATAVTNTIDEWNGFDWVTIDPAVAPIGRSASAMAYDRAIDRTVLFGGFDGTYEVGDTWLWNGAVWTPADAGGPVGRSDHLMVYDPRRSVVVLFGGVRTGLGVLDDTWEFDGKTWTQKTTAHKPPARASAQAVYDPKAGLIVMTGGNTGFTPVTYFADTWTYDGVDWHDVTPAGVAPRVADAGIGYDLASQQVLMYGGTTTNGVPTGATWAWNGSTWTNLGTSVAVGARFLSAIAGTRTRTILHGGIYNSAKQNDTYVWDPTTKLWTGLPPVPARSRLSAVNDFAGHRAIFYGGINATFATVADTWELGSKGYQLLAGGPPTKRQYYAMAWDPAHSQIVLFGGASGNTISDTVSAETWVWTGAGWTQKFPATSPPPRSRAAMAWDGERIVMFGGHNSEYSATATFGDAWAWDGTTWTPITGTLPPPRHGAAAGYDPIRNQLVMYGGNYNLDDDDDTWLEHAGVWTEAQHLGFVPTRESEAALAWNPARSSLILTGGTAVGNQTYEWNGT